MSLRCTQAGMEELLKAHSRFLPMQRGQKCGQSNNFWENYEDDIARVVSLKATVFRLSLGAKPTCPWFLACVSRVVYIQCELCSLVLGTEVWV